MAFGRGERIGDAYVQIHANGDGMDEEIRKGFKNADKDVDEAGRRHAKEYGDGFDKEERRSKRILKALTGSLTRAKNDPEMNRAGKDLSTRISELLSPQHRDDGAWIDNVVRDMHKLSLVSRTTGADFRRVNTAINDGEKISHGFFSSFRDGFKGVHKSVGELEGFRKKVDEVDNRVDHYADVAGKAFGRGARNNFINLFGAGVRGFALLANVVPKALKGFFAFKDSLSGIQQAMAGTEGGLSKLGAGAGAATQAFGGAALGVVGLGVGISVLILAIGPLVAIVSGLTAAVIALAASLSFAAVAGVGALAGAFLPLAAGIGVVVLALTGLSKAQKTLLTNSLNPLTKELKNLGAVARNSLVHDLADSARGLTPVLKGLEPLVRGVAASLGDVARNFVNNLQSPGFTAFKRDLTAFLPGAVRTLGFAITNTFGGVGGIFRALLPLTTQFLGWLEKITQNFSDWANSARGQRQLISFFRDAAESAKSVGRFAKEAVLVVAQLLNQGRSTGNSIFDSMANSLGRFVNFLRANPDAVSRFFANGAKVASGVGQAIMGIVDVFKAFDTETNRFLGGALLTQIATGFRILGAAVTLATIPMRVLISTIGSVLIGIGHLMNAVDKLSLMSDPFGGLGDSIISAGKSMKNFVSSTGGVSSSSSSAASSVGSLADTLDQVTGAATQATRAFVLNQIQTSGAAGAAHAFGVSNRDMIDAVLGSKDALAKINNQLALGGPFTIGLREKLAALGIQFTDSGKKIRSTNADLTSWRDALAGIKDKNVRVAIRETGMEPTIGKFKQLIATQKLTPRQIRIAAKALNVDLTKKQLNALIATSKDVGKQKPKITPKVDTGPGRKNLSALRGDMNQTARQPVKPKITIDIGAARTNMSRVSEQMHTTDRLRANPKVNVDVNGTGAIRTAIALINAVHSKTVTVTTHAIHTGPGGPRPTAVGGTFRFAQDRLIAESGPEAVVPLNRPLDQVDPSVRWLSAVAQGKLPGMAAGGVVGGSGRNVTIEQATFVSNSPDPVTAAREWSNRLVELAYH